MAQLPDEEVKYFCLNYRELCFLYIRDQFSLEYVYPLSTVEEQYGDWFDVYYMQLLMIFLIRKALIFQIKNCLGLEY